MKAMRFLALTALAAISLAAADVPRPAPEFTVHMPGGKDFKLSDYKGKIVFCNERISKNTL